MRHGPFRGILRAARRSLRRLRGGGVPVVYHARYRQSVFGVPLDPLRGEKIQGALAEAGLLRADLVSEPKPASLENLLRVHTPEYLHELQEARRSRASSGSRWRPPRPRARSSCSG